MATSGTLAGRTALVTGEDVAEAVLFVASRPASVTLPVFQIKRA